MRPPGSAPVVLRCRECGNDGPNDGPQYCESCFGPLEVVLPRPVGSPVELRERIGSGLASVARYEVLLPEGLDLSGRDAGWTQLRETIALGRALGLTDLWAKDETANPSGSFKDRVVEVAVARGLRMGARVLACSSTGNLARSVAGTAVRRGMRSVVLVPEELDPVEIADLASRGAVVVGVRGGYDAASRLAAEAASDLSAWAWVNVTLRPWYELGARTTGWEIVEQLRWTMPDRVVVPMASGALARALHESMEWLAELGLAKGDLPKLTVVQPAGCAPVAAAFAAGEKRVRPVRDPATVAESLAMGDPPDGDAVLAAARATGGGVYAVAEDRILDAVELIRTTEHIVVEPAGGVVIAGLRDLVEQGVVDPDERVVAVLTGSPPRLRSSEGPGGVVPGEGLAGTIDPSVDALVALLPDELLR